MRQIAECYLGFTEGVDKDVLFTYYDEALNDREFNTLVLKHWRINKGGTDERLRLYIALNAAAQDRVNINPDTFSFLIETPDSPGQLFLLYIVISALFWT